MRAVGLGQIECCLLSERLSASLSVVGLYSKYFERELV